MSLESGRKFGLTASLIAITAPIILAIAYVGLFISLLGSVSSTIGRSTSPNISLLPFTALGIVVAAVVVGVIICILLLIAMNNLSKYYSEPAIFKNLLNALILSIIGIVVIGVVLAAFFVASIARTASSPAVSAIWVIGGLGGLFLGILAIVIYSAFLTKRAFDKLGDKSGIDSFRTAGLLFLIGAFVPLVAYVGCIFAAIGYNQLTPNKQVTNSMPQYVTPAGTVKRCPHCGTENSPDATYCKNCGRQI
jgi:uncharacterized membrane protein